MNNLEQYLAMTPAQRSAELQRLSVAQAEHTAQLAALTREERLIRAKQYDLQRELTAQIWHIELLHAIEAQRLK